MHNCIWKRHQTTQAKLSHAVVAFNWIFCWIHTTYRSMKC